jgi:hypothetical protein
VLAQGSANAAPTPRAGHHSAEQIGALVTLVGRLARARSPSPPLPHQAVLLADARLILT